MRGGICRPGATSRIDNSIFRREMTEAPAIFLLANDRVLANVVQLLNSLRVHGLTNKVFCIGFNEEIHFLKKVCRVFGVDGYDVDLERIDALGRRIYDRDPPAKPYPYCLGKLRKLSFLTFPGPAVYLDADCIVTATAELFNQAFAMPAPGIGYINTSPDGVYEAAPAAAALRDRSTFLTSGMIAKSRAAVDIAAFERFFDNARIEQFHKVRRRGGYVDQPLWNFLVDSGFFPAVDLLADTRVSRVTSLTGELTLGPDGSASVGGLPVLLLHLAGPELKKSPRYRYLLDGMLLGGLREIAAADPASFSEINRFLFSR
jgi:hypothetical protein